MLGNLFGHFLACLFMGTLMFGLAITGLEDGSLSLLILGGSGMLFFIYMFFAGIKEEINKNKKDQ